jgi:ubiquilin
MGGMGGAQPPVDNVDPKVKYANELESMKEMGFVNEETNIEALKSANGNVQAAIERLLNMLG